MRFKPKYRTGLVIALSGVDCSGKSTQRELLTQYLQERGYQVVGIWSRLGYTPGITLLKDLGGSLLGKKKRADKNPLMKSGQYPKRAEHINNPLRRWLWINLALIDLIWLFGIRFKTMKALGRTVICDRYLLDVAVDCRVNFPNNHIERSILFRLLKMVSVKPDLSFCFLIPAQESLLRGRKKNRSHWEPVETLQNRYQGYKDMGEKSGVDLIDAMQPMESIAQDIRCRVEQVD